MMYPCPVCGVVLRLDNTDAGDLNVTITNAGGGTFIPPSNNVPSTLPTSRTNTVVDRRTSTTVHTCTRTRNP